MGCSCRQRGISFLCQTVPGGIRRATIHTQSCKQFMVYGLRQDIVAQLRKTPEDTGQDFKPFLKLQKKVCIFC